MPQAIQVAHGILTKTTILAYFAPEKGANKLYTRGPAHLLLLSTFFVTFFSKKVILVVGGLGPSLGAKPPYNMSVNYVNTNIK